MPPRFFNADEGNTGTGGSADPNGASGTPPPPPPPAAGRVYTEAEHQAEINRVVQERLARAAKKPDPAPPPPKQQQAPNASSESKADPTQTLMDFQDYMDSLEGVKVPLGLKKRMRADFMAAKPSDPDAWGSAWLADVGITTTTTQTTKAASEPKAGATTVTTPPISDKGPPSGVREFDQITNPTELTRDDIERLYAKHGEEKANELIAQMARRYLRDKKFVPGK